MNLMSDNFQRAYRRAREKIGEAEWPLLSSEQQSEAVARELRALEAERPARPADDDQKEK
jgi:hypothetical protein